jgi:hypothetical protein
VKLYRSDVHLCVIFVLGDSFDGGPRLLTPFMGRPSFVKIYEQMLLNYFCVVRVSFRLRRPVPQKSQKAFACQRRCEF